MKIEKRSKYDERNDAIKYLVSFFVTGLTVFGLLMLIMLFG